MNQFKLPALICEGFCPICSFKIEFPSFEFSYSYYDISKDIMIRISEEHVLYNKNQITDIEKHIKDNLGKEYQNDRIINTDKMIYCKKCKNIIEKDNLLNKRTCCEEHVIALDIS